MNKLKKALGFMILVFCLAMTTKVNSQAAGKLTGIKQTDASTTSITVSVTADFSAEYYQLELKNMNDTTWTAAGKTSNANSIYSSVSLSAGKSYKARVRGYSDYNCTSPVTDYSDELEVVTTPSVSNMKAVQSNAKTNYVSIKYTGVVGANYYIVTYDDTVIASSKSTTVTTPKKLSAGTSYWVRCYAARVSPSGYIACPTYSYDYICVKTLKKAIGSKSFGVSLAYQNSNVFYFALSMSGSYDGTQLQFLTPSGKVKKTITGDTSYRVADFINGNFYKYRVRSYVKCGTKKVYSAWSSCHYIGVAKTYSGKSYSTSKKTIKVSWSKVTNASKYVVYISKSKNSGFKKVKTVGASSRKITLTKYGKSSLKKNTTYYVKIVSQAKVGKKTVSSSVYWLGTSY